MSYANELLLLLLRSISVTAMLLLAFLPGYSHGEQSLNGDDNSHRSNSILNHLGDNDIILYLEVFLNQVRYPNLLPIIQRNQKLFARASDLKTLGFIVREVPDTNEIELNSLPGLDIAYSVNTQQLQLTAPLSLLSLPVTKIWTSKSLPTPKSTASPGSLLNYDIYFNHDQNQQFASAATEFRVFGFGNGVFSHTTNSHSIRTENGIWESDSVALDTFAEWSFPESATRLVIGDSVSGGLHWTRSLRFTGVQLGRSFKLQPYRTITPLASFVGKAALPSSVELYIDGVRRYQSDVPPGPFEINAAPSITGMGQAQVVTTDSFGRSTTINIPFYNTQQLLRKGLSDWSLNTGFIHKDYGIKSFSYGDELSTSGSIRYGVSNRLTMEGHAELSNGLINGGIGAAWRPGLMGVLNLAYTHSNHNGIKGYQTAWRYSWNNTHVNFSVASQRTFGQYRDLASHYGSLPARRSEQILAGLHTARLGNIGINATRFDNGDKDVSVLRYAGIHWNNNVNNGLSVYLSFNQNLNEKKDRTVRFGVNVAFDSNLQFHSSAQRNNGKNNYQASLQRPLPSDNGFGWRLQGSDYGTTTNSLIQGSWQGNYARIDAGVAHVNRQNHGYAQTSGSLVWMDGKGFASRRINDSFAVVSTSGVAGLPVKLENRVIGYTNKSGHLLITRLNAWQRNSLSVDPMDLPADHKITDVYQVITPSDRAGTLAEFTIEKVRAAIVLLTDQDGNPLPVASRVITKPDSGRPIFVGFDGQTYIEQLQDYNHLQIITPSGTCIVEFEMPSNENPGHYIGPYSCLKAR